MFSPKNKGLHSWRSYEKTTQEENKSNDRPNKSFNYTNCTIFADYIQIMGNVLPRDNSGDMNYDNIENLYIIGTIVNVFFILVILLFNKRMNINVQFVKHQ